MSLIYMIGVLLLVGLTVWVIGQLPWIDAGIKKVIYIIIIVCVCVWLIAIFTGVSFSSLNMRIGR